MLHQTIGCGEMAEKRQCLAVVRVRGSSGASLKQRKTLELLSLTRNCHITIIDNRPSFVGMLQNVGKYVTWGEITSGTLLELLEKRGRLVGDQRLDATYAQRVGYPTLEELAEAIFKLEIEFRHLPNIKPVFRAHPPRRGYKGKTKKAYAVGGVIGYRGQAINALIEKMI